MRSVTPALLPELFALNEMQVGRALPEGDDFHQEVLSAVLQGGDGYCLHAPLQQHSQDTADLLRALQTLVAANQDAPHRANDIVHGDFAHANILLQDERISGVVDWTGSYAGDCSYDLATLLFYSYESVEARERLWQYALTRASLGLLGIYLAHLILREVDWSLRHHDAAISAGWTASAQKLLQEVAYRDLLRR